ncbi:MAG: C1 family peptidase, partial [Bacteroidales bacterium]
TQRVTMKNLLIFSISLFGVSLYSQPESFSWDKRHNYENFIINYISEAKNQKEQGPCGAFAAVAAVEAVSQIYFNKTSPMIDLSESNIYSNNDSTVNCPGVGCGSIGILAPLNLINSTGIVDEDCFEYPEEPLPVENSTQRFCYRDCEGIICDNPAYRVFIPHNGNTGQINIQNNTQLK